jgi:predicted RNA-binding Zn-ribbon protein involved in translation (DUF1610 family)
MAQFCVYCGAQLHEEGTFCPTCGKGKVSRFYQHKFEEEKPVELTEAELLAASGIPAGSPCPKCGSVRTLRVTEPIKASRWWKNAVASFFHCYKCGEKWQPEDSVPVERVGRGLYLGIVVAIMVAVIIFAVGKTAYQERTHSASSGGASNNHSAVNTPSPSPSPVAPVKAISSAERGYISASRDYLGSANADGTQMATVMAGGANGTSSLADIHAAIRKNLAKEKQRYSTYLRTRGTVPPTFTIVDKHIGEVHTKSVAALSLLLSYWTTGDLTAIPRGSDQYQAAILQMNSTIEEATSILKGMK